MKLRRVRLPGWFVFGKFQPGPRQHPWKWVQCFACNSISRMEKDHLGSSRLPEGWAKVVPIKDGKGLAEVYASPVCAMRAGVLAGAKWDTKDVTIITQTLRPITHVDLTFQVPKPK